MNTPQTAPSTTHLSDATARDGSKFEKNLEALRGLAAFVVLLHHGLAPYYLDPHFRPSGIFTYDPPGHDSVILFFILSGFVIGLTNKGYLTLATVGAYIKKRLVRIYPIYFISVLFALGVSAFKYRLVTILLNMAFLQIVAATVITENSPIWTLHYEIVFYLMFIPFSLFRLGPKILALILTVIGFLNYFVQDIFYSPLLSTYLFGFTFWLLGIVISNNFKTKRPSISYPLLVSQLLLFMSLNYMNPIETLLRKATIMLFHHQLSFSEASVWYNKINIYDYALVPYAFVCILVFINASFQYRGSILRLLQLLPVLHLVYIFKNRHDADLINPFIIPVGLYIISTLIFFSRKYISSWSGNGLIEALVRVGSISYGLYIIHYPFLYIFNRIEVFSGTPFTYVVRLMIFILIVFLGAYFLEKRFQQLVIRFVRTTPQKLDSLAGPVH